MSRGFSGRNSACLDREDSAEPCDDSYKLFYRAIVEQDADAWEAIAAQYRRMMISWVVRCHAYDAARESSEDLADRALARAWAALSAKRFATFPSTATLLGYLRACVTTTVIDAARAHTAYERAVQPAEHTSAPTAEQDTLARLERTELWELMNKLVTSEAERVALVERFVLNLPPRRIQARHPLLFADVLAVYTCIRNLCNRLRRNRDLRQLYTEFQE